MKGNAWVIVGQEDESEKLSESNMQAQEDEEEREELDGEMHDDFIIHTENRLAIQYQHRPKLEVRIASSDTVSVAVSSWSPEQAVSAFRNQACDG